MMFRGMRRVCALAAVAAAAMGCASAERMAAQSVSDLAGMVVGNAVAITNGSLSSCEEQKFVYTRRNAPYVSVHFKRFTLAEGDRVTIATANGSEVREISPQSGVSAFSSDRVPGPTAVVTFLPSGCKRASVLPSTFGFEIDALEYTFAQTVKKEDACGAANQNQAAVCFKNKEGVQPAVYKSAMAVARLITGSGDGPKTSCTGWLLGSEGHLVTNHHCIKNADEANRTNFEFMVQSPACDSSCKIIGDCREFGAVESLGSDFVYSNEKYDFAVVKLRKKPCVLNGKYGFLSLRKAPPAEKEPIYLVQHPNGGAKVITYTQDIDNVDADPTTGDSGTMQAEVAVVNDENNLGDFWTSYYADTEPGSSGSPVISLTSHQVIAVHANGACKNSGAPSHLIIGELLANNVALPDDAFA